MAPPVRELEPLQDAALMEVIVPEGVTPGSTIEALVRQRSFQITVPDGAASGDALVFSTASSSEHISDDPASPKQVEVPQSRLPSESCCSACGRPPEPGACWHVCSGCLSACYCSRGCQRHAWRLGHRDVCQPARQLPTTSLIRQSSPRGASAGPAKWTWRSRAH